MSDPYLDGGIYQTPWGQYIDLSKLTAVRGPTYTWGAYNVYAIHLSFQLMDEPIVWTSNDPLNEAVKEVITAWKGYKRYKQMADRTPIAREPARGPGGKT